jgi:hypothetical protein
LEPSSLIIPGTVEGSSSWQRTFGVILETRDEDLLVGSGAEQTFKTSVTLKAGANLRIACGLDSNGDPAWEADGECSLKAGMNDAWTFTKSGGQWYARLPVWVGRNPSGPGATGKLDTWMVHASSSLTSPAVKMLDVGYTPLMGAAPQWNDAPSFSSRALYQGSMTVHSPAAKGGVSERGPAGDLRFPIVAAISPSCDLGGTCLVIQDPTHILTSKETVTLPLSGTPTTIEWIVPMPRVSVSGTVSATLKATSLSQQDVTKRLLGKIAIRAGIDGDSTSNFDYTASYELSPWLSTTKCAVNGDCGSGGSCVQNRCAQKACNANTDCSPGLTCQRGLCAHSEAVTTSSQYPTILNDRYDGWISAANNLVLAVARESKVNAANHLTSHWFNDLYSRETGVGGSFTPQKNHLLGKSLVREASQSPEMTAAVCREGFGTYLSRVSGLIQSSTFSVQVTNGGWAYVEGSMTNPSGAVCHPNNLSNGRVPCIERRTQPGQSANLVAAFYDNGTLSENAFCEDIHAAIERSHNLTGSDFETVCPRPNGQNVLKISTAAGYLEEHVIRLCPDWVDVFTYPYYSPRTDVERFLTYKQTPVTTGGVLASSALAMTSACDTNLFSPSSGDAVVCGTSTPAGGVKLLSHPDQPGTSMTAAELLTACVADLGRQVPNLKNKKYDVGGTTAASDLEAMFGQRTCFEAAQYYGALAAAATALGESSPDAGMQRFRLRLLQQWVELHSFLAQQGLEVERLARTEAASSVITSSLTTPATMSPTNLDELLRRMEEAWSLVLVHAKAGRTFNASTSVLRAPDYRPNVVRDSNVATRRDAFTGPPHADEDYEQRSGLAPALLEGLAAHMRLLTEQLRSVAEADYQGPKGSDLSKAAEAALDRFGSALRYALAIEDVSTRMKEAALAQPPACTTDSDCVGFDPPDCVHPANVCAPSAWAGHWNDARMAYLEARQEAVAMAATLRRGQNPLGVDEDDLPLFFGDLTGTNSRFFASSDYLMNTWATSAVASARGALTEAREAWLKQRDSKIMDEVNDNERQRRLDAIKRDYGGRIASACGLNGTVSAEEAFDLTMSGKLSLFDCYIDTAREECTRLPDPPPDDTQPRNDAFNDCMKNLKKEDEDAQKIKNDPCFMFFEHFPGQMKGYVQMLPTPEFRRSIRWNERRENCNNDYIDVNQNPPQWKYCEGGDCFIDATCEDERTQVLRRDCDYGEYQRKLLALFWKDAPTDQALYCQNQANVSVKRTIASSPLPLHCYRGELGVAMTKALAAQQDVDLATLDWQDVQTRYWIQGRLCNRKSAVPELVQEMNDAFEEQIKSLMEARGKAQLMSTVVSGSIGAFQAATSSSGSGKDASSQGAAQAFATVTGVISAEINRNIAGLNDSMALAEIQHSQFLSEYLAQEAAYACHVDLESLRVGFDALRNTIVRRETDFGTATIEATGAFREIERSVTEGETMLAREEGRTVGSYSFHYWFDEKVARYNREFAWAKRLTYLTLRAVEYEFQQSFSLRKQILTARHPDELETALRAMQTELATRTINRRRPEESSVVLSLRDDVLATPNQIDAANGDRAYSASLNFRSRLWDDRYSLRDKSGRWIGQGIPFSLGPQGALLNRCGERLWRVTATIQGDGLSDTQPGATVYLLKKNTFASQWCDARGNGSATTMQVGAIQPSRNLFRGDQAASAGETQAYSTASLYPWFNVRRSNFYKLQYQDGASDELAGRGLYGDYILLFPRQLLEGGKPIEPGPGEVGETTRTEKFPLGRVEDVLLRFDYLSVDNAPAVGN